jgi:hypothetical protein
MTIFIIPPNFYPPGKPGRPHLLRSPGLAVCLYSFALDASDLRPSQLFQLQGPSAKGLDFDLVYLVGADRINPTDETRDRLTRLIYVAITRGKYRLVIPYVEETDFISRFRDCLTIL